MSHTPEPWGLTDAGVSAEISSGPQGFLAYVSTAGGRGRNLDEAKANAERIIRCVNFCAGFSNEILKPGGLADLVGAVEMAKQMAEKFESLTKTTP
jgi:hypothetical protein